MLTPNVVEIVLDVPQKFSFKPGQRALLGYQDAEGSFKRAYSIVNYQEKENNILVTLCIKLLDPGRGSSLLKEAKVGDQIDFAGIFGHFQLQDTDVQKIFIGTGTGLVSVFNMASNAKGDHNKLIFSISYHKDLFYEDKIKAIAGLDVHIHISREELPGYEFGRIDLAKYSFDSDAEFYICGNPLIVKDMVEKVKALGYTKIFSEQF